MTARKKPRSEFEAMIAQGWTLIDPGGGVWRKYPDDDRPLLPPAVPVSVTAEQEADDE